jgi:Fe-S-cluster-containing hydrogenase component 2
MSQANFQKAEQLSIYSGNCLRSRSPLSTCASCETLCPEQALLFQDDKWQAQNCSLCGLCAMVCPGQVFQIDQHRVMQHQKGQPLFYAAVRIRRLRQKPFASTACSSFRRSL